MAMSPQGAAGKALSAVGKAVMGGDGLTGYLKKKKYPLNAVAAARKKPSMDDVQSLGKGVQAARSAARSASGVANAFLEPNKKQPTGWEPVVTGPSVNRGEPKGTIVIARSKTANANLRASRPGKVFPPGVNPNKIKVPNGGALGKPRAEDDAINPKTGKPFWDQKAKLLPQYSVNPKNPGRAQPPANRDFTPNTAVGNAITGKKKYQQVSPPSTPKPKRRW